MGIGLEVGGGFGSDGCSTIIVGGFQMMCFHLDSRFGREEFEVFVVDWLLWLLGQ